MENSFYLCTRNKTDKEMKNYCTLSDTDLMAIINQVLNAETVEDKEARRRAKVRKAKADFCNLDATDYCKFVEA